jgi:hypothetical protein
MNLFGSKNGFMQKGNNDLPKPTITIENIEVTGTQKPYIALNDARPLKNADFYSSSRKANILTTGIH